MKEAISDGIGSDPIHHSFNHDPPLSHSVHIPELVYEIADSQISVYDYWI